MTLDISLFTLIMLLFFIDRVAENGFNWWIRLNAENERSNLFPLIVYLIRTFFLLVILNDVL